MAASVVDILMYHSIAEAEGPTSISPDVFAAQMAAIEEASVPVVTMDDLLEARNGGRALPGYSIIITFDDGFRDFLQAAYPVLEKHGVSAMVYLPTDAIGRCESWAGAYEPPRQLMSWHEIQWLSQQGIHFGSHTVSHANLTSLSPEALEAELSLSRAEIEDRLSRRIVHFAPPYGMAGKEVRAAISRHYESSVGTRLGSVRAKADLFDLPRLEMFYYTDIARWRSHLQGRGQAYLHARRMLRRVRQTMLYPWQ